MKDKRDLPVIGATEYVEIAGIKKIPAKIDTGADSSSIWVSNIRVTEDGALHFCLFDEENPLYTGDDLACLDFRAVIVRSASGHEQIRYRTKLPIIINGHEIKADFNLSDRSNNIFPVLIGRRTLSGKFLVDVSKKRPDANNTLRAQTVQDYLEKDPYGFHQKYMKEYPGSISKLKLKKGV